MTMTTALRPRVSPHIRLAAAPDAPDEIDDATLVERLTRRDEHALALLVERHSALVLRAARRQLRTIDVAYDVAQEVFLARWTRPEAVDMSRGKLESFLVTLADRRAIDVIRSETARRRRRRSLDVLAPFSDGWTSHAVHRLLGMLHTQHGAYDLALEHLSESLALTVESRFALD